MKEKQANAESECTQYERLKVKLQNLELYELKMADDGERAKMDRMRKKLGFMKPVDTLNNTITDEVQSTPCSFTTEQSLSRSVNKAQKSS